MPRSPTPNSSLSGRDHAPDDVLVDLVHEDHEAEHPHRLVEDPYEERALDVWDRFAGRLVRGRPEFPAWRRRITTSRPAPATSC